MLPEENKNNQPGVADPSAEGQPNAGTPDPNTILDILTQDEEGNYVLKLDPDDEKSTVYKGKSREDVYKQLAKGKLEADKTIRQFKEKENKFPNIATEEVTEPTEIEPKYADKDAIFDKIYKEMNLDPAMATWGDEQWKDYEHDHGSVNTMKLMQAEQRARSIAENNVMEINKNELNKTTLVKESKKLESVLVEYGVEEKDFDYRTFLQGFMKDEKNYQESGLLVPGALTAEGTKAALKVVRQKMRDQVETDIAKSEKEKNKLPNADKTDKKFDKPSGKTPKNSDEAVEQALAEIRAGKGSLWIK